MVSAVLGELRPKSRASRVAMVAAAGWGLSALLHIGVFAMRGGELAGPVSWRKPIVFSLSMGLTLWAVGWVIDQQPVKRPRLAGFLAWSFAVTASVETSLIILQTWRGRASHFNTFEAGDAVVFGLMGVTVALMSVVLVILFAWSLKERPTDPAARWAVIGGLLMVVASLGIGQWLVNLGVQFATEFGVVPDTVMQGQAVVKFPHAVGFHGIQVFAGLLAVGTAVGLATTQRLRFMRLAVVGYGGLLIFAVAQTVMGVSLRTLSPATGTILVASLVAVGWAAVGTGLAARQVVAESNKVLV